MAGERTLPGLGLLAFWNYESDGWNDGMDANLRALSALVHLAAGSRTEALPGSPTNGQIRIVPANATANANAIAVRDNGVWVYLAPKIGMRAYVTDTESFVTFNGTLWVDDEPAGLPDAPVDGKSYVRRNGEWVEAATDGSGGALAKFNDYRVVWTGNTDGSFAGVAEIRFDGQTGSNGSAFASSSFDSNSGPAKAFDGSPSTNWFSGSGAQVNAHIGYSWAVARTVEKLSLTAPSTAPRNTYMPPSFRVEARADGGEWVNVGEFNPGGWATGETREFGLNLPSATPGGEGVEEAPKDGKLYGRKDGGWAPAVSGEGVDRIVKLTQAAYDALDPKDPNALYAVVG